MVCTVIWFYRNNLITGACNVFINDLDLWPVITLGSFLQTKPNSHPEMDRAALAGLGGRIGLA